MDLRPRIQVQGGEEARTILAVLMKTEQDVKRLTSERNAILYEYSRVMSERDVVHKELEKLQDDLLASTSQSKTFQVENEKLRDENKSLKYRLEALNRELASILSDRDSAMMELRDARKTASGCSDPRNHGILGHNSSGVPTECLDSRSAIQLRQQLEATQSDSNETRPQAEVFEQGADWTLKDRDLAMLQLESLRMLCDELRKKRDQAQFDLAQALRDSNDMRQQMERNLREMEDLRNRSGFLPKDKERVQERLAFDENSKDSAIGSEDLDPKNLDGETETVEVELNCAHEIGSVDLGFELACTGDPGLHVVSVTEGGFADGKLRVYDRFVKVGPYNCESGDLEAVKALWDTLRISSTSIVVTLKRQGMSAPGIYSVTLEPGRGTLGLELENRVYIRSVNETPSIARKTALRSGDRLYSINGKPVHSSTSSADCYRLINDIVSRHDGACVVTVVRGFPVPTTPPSLGSPTSSPSSRARTLSEDVTDNGAQDIPTSPTDSESEAAAIAVLEAAIDSYNPYHLIQDDDSKLTSSKSNKKSVRRRSPSKSKYFDPSQPKHQDVDIQFRSARSWPRHTEPTAHPFHTINLPRTRSPLSVFIAALRSSVQKSEEPKRLSFPSYLPSEGENHVALEWNNAENTIFTGKHAIDAQVNAATISKQLAETTEVTLGDGSGLNSPLKLDPSPFYGSDRIRLPSYSNFTSPTSTLERTSEHGSPKTNFKIEVLDPGSQEIIHELPSTDAELTSSSSQELRKLCCVFENSSQSLGIQICCSDDGGVFISSVTKSSLAAQMGLQEGDQILEVCGINMRNANFDQAAHVLHQSRSSGVFTLLVQYKPARYRELQQVPSEYQDKNAPNPSTCFPSRDHLRLNNLQNSDQSEGSVTDAVASQEKPLSLHEPVKMRRKPRTVSFEMDKRDCINGISLVGGNAVGIYIHTVLANSLAYQAGLRSGDRILEFNGTNLREATAEQAALELGKVVEHATLKVLSELERYKDIVDRPGDGFYVRAQFDNLSVKEGAGQLSFQSQDVLYVDNTMLNGVPGQWRAWLIDDQGRQTTCGIIPSQFKAEQEVFRRSHSIDFKPSHHGSRRSLTLFTSLRKKFRFSTRDSARDSKEIASSDANIDLLVRSSEELIPSIVNTRLSPRSYVRVRKLECQNVKRPVLLLGPLSDLMVDLLVRKFANKFIRGVPEMLEASQSPSTANRLHCLWSAELSSLEMLSILHKQCTNLIVVLLKFKSVKHVRRISDAVLTARHSSAVKTIKEAYKCALAIEEKNRNLISVVVSAGDHPSEICNHLEMVVEQEQKRIIWVPENPLGCNQSSIPGN